MIVEMIVQIVFLIIIRRKIQKFHNRKKKEISIWKRKLKQKLTLTREPTPKRELTWEREPTPKQELT
jgi:hypothetical protein